MFKTKMTGTKAKVTRTLTLPKSGQLAEKTIEDSYEIDIDLAGLDPKSPVAQSMLKTFPKVLDNELNATRGRWDKRNVKIWTDVGTALAKKGVTEDKGKALLQAAEKQIVANWNEYNEKVAKRTALSVVNSLAKAEARKAGQKAKEHKIKFWSDGLKNNRFDIYGSFLGAMVIGAVAGPLGWIGAGLAGALNLGKGYRSAWQIAQKQSDKIETNVNLISDGLKDAQSALKKLEPHLGVVAASQQDFSAQMVLAQARLNEMQKELAKLEARAKTEKAVREGGYLNELSGKIGTQAAKVAALGKAIDAQADLRNKVQAAVDAVDAAEAAVKARRTGWDKIMKVYSDASKDSDALMSALNKLVKQLG